MRYAAFITLALVGCAIAFPAQATELVANDGTGEVRISDAPCTNPTILSYLRAESRPQFHAAWAIVRGRRYAGCWMEAYGQAAVVFEGPAQWIYPLSAFKPVPEV